MFPQKHLTGFDYLKLAGSITGETSSALEYCIGEIRWESNNPFSQNLYKNQQTLFYDLEQQGIIVKKGFMLKINGVYNEKGVDVRMAIDILKGALKDEYDVCYIVSSDTDIIPAIKEARDAGKQLVYVGFEGIVSRAMSANCSKTFIITKNMLDKCYAQPNP